MVEFKIPVQIDGFKCVEEMAQAVLNYTYKGKTLQEWADSISKPKTNADRIRSMSDEELAEFMCHNVSNGTVNCTFCAASEFCRMGHNGWLDWLKQEADDDKSGQDQRDDG